MYRWVCCRRTLGVCINLKPKADSSTSVAVELLNKLFRRWLWAVGCVIGLDNDSLVTGHGDGSSDWKVRYEE